MPFQPVKRLPQDTTTGLAIDPNADATSTNAAIPNLTGSGTVGTSTSTITVSDSASSDSAPAPASSASSANAPPASSSNSGPAIPVAAVVGACVGAFVILLVLIFFVRWHLRRANATSGDISKRRNFERRKSHHSTWNHLRDSTHDSSSDGHGLGMSKGFDLKMDAFPVPPISEKERQVLREREQEQKRVNIAEKLRDPPQISPLPFETDQHVFKFSPPSPSPFSNMLPPARPPPVVSPPTAPSTHPYALATPMPTPMPRNSVPLSLMSEASFYSETPVVTHQHDSIFSDASTTPMIPSQRPVVTSVYPKAPIVPEPLTLSVPAEQAPSESRHRNPFFTAHPKHQNTAEKWGSVGKERVVASPTITQGVSSPTYDGDLASAIPNNTMENLIAALDLTSANTSISIPHPLERSFHGHLSMAPSDEGEVDRENPFEFDNVYSQDLASPTSSRHAEAYINGGSTPYTSKSFLTDTSADMSGWSTGGISPGAFPLPPR